MGQSDDDFFAALIADSQMQSSARYFEEGTYLVQIDNAKIFKNRNRQPRAGVECTVVQSNNARIGASSSVSWVVSLDNDSGPGTVKSWVSRVFETPESEITGEAVKRIFVMEGEEGHRVSPASGFHCLVNAYEKETSKGGVFTKCEWKRVIDGRDTLPDFTIRSGAASSVAREEQIMSPLRTTDEVPF